MTPSILDIFSNAYSLSNSACWLIRSKNEDWRPEEPPPLSNPPALYDEGSTFAHLLELFEDFEGLDDDEVKKYIDDFVDEYKQLMKESII